MDFEEVFDLLVKAVRHIDGLNNRSIKKAVENDATGSGDR